MNTKSNFCYVPLCWCAARNEEEISRCAHRPYNSGEGSCDVRGNDSQHPTCNSDSANMEAFLNHCTQYEVSEILKTFKSDIKFENRRWS